jgi:hypothetical protein
LVHVTEDVLGSYIKELSRTLRPDGVAIIHHSNLGSYKRLRRCVAPIDDVAREAPWKVRRALKYLGVGLAAGWRDPNPTAETFAALCETTGVHCIGQELIPWFSGPYLTDCISTITRPTSAWSRPNRVARNRRFMAEARSIRTYSDVYA